MTWSILAAIEHARTGLKLTVVLRLIGLSPSRHRERGWRRPRTRVHFASPKQGVRATEPNEYWHIDVTIIRLLDRTKAYLHAVMGNVPH